MKLRTLLMRALRGDTPDEPVRLHCLTKTVTVEEAAKLAAKPRLILETDEFKVARIPDDEYYPLG